MNSSDNKDLKSRIEQVLSEGKHDFTELEVEKLIETVNIYHVELEYQNDELRRIQHELENSKTRYASLFKYAPIGYVICNDDAEIEAVNKSFLSLINRESIEKYEKFSNYVDPQSQDQFYLFYKSLINNKNPDSIEIHLSGRKEMVPIKLEANIFFEHDRLQTRLAITDLTTQKNYEQQIEYKSWELEERLKELNCIHEITKTTAVTSIPTEEVFNKVLEVIPDSFQYPEITVAEIQFHDKRFFSSGYRDYKKFIKAEIRFMDEVEGAVIVGLTEELPKSESPFLPEEEKLIASIAEILSKFLQKRRTRKMLMQSELQLNKAQEISKTGSWTFHLGSGKVSASQEAYRIYGLDPEKPLSIKDAQSLSLPEYRDMLDERIEKLIKYNDPYDVEFQIQQPGGRIIDIHSIAEYDPETNIVTGFIQDISEQKENLQRIKLLSRSIEQNPVAIVITDNKGNIDYVNPAFSSITGYNTEEVIGENPRILKSGYQDKAFYIDLWKTITSGKDWFGIMKNRKKNGDFYWEEAIISPIVDENGRITNFVAVKEDISERKRLMEDLVKAKERAEESDHLKSAFLANMSHEIRTPMNGILGFTNLLKKPDLSSEKKDKFIDIIHSSGKRMLNTVNDIVEISKIEAGLITTNFEEANILTRVEEIVQFFQEEASEKGIKVIIDDEKNLPEKIIVVTDPRKFDGILINLVKNAIKFTKAGSVAVEINNDEHNLHLAVKDTGMGIPKERQKAIFNRFEQAENTETRKFEGSGLGLAITTSYVEILKGKIWLESEIGKGSTFYVTLPMDLKPD